jgi:hypothetical protein
MTAELPALTAEIEARGEWAPAFEGDNTMGWGGFDDDEVVEPRVVERRSTLLPAPATPEMPASASDFEDTDEHEPVADEVS